MNTIAEPAVRSNTQAPASHIAYRRDIDGLRAVAVLAVLVFHAFPQALPGGFIGVDVFFVISGFLITKVILTNLERGTFTVGGFYVRRVRRIFPALVATLAACLLFGWHTMLAEDFAHLAKHAFGGASFLANIFLWQEAGYFDKVSEMKPLLHLWSLGIEEQFYVAWPLILWFAWRRKLSIRMVIFALAGVSFLINIAGIAHHQTASFYSPLSRSWELLLGAAIAHRRAPTRFGQAQRSAASIAGVALILIAMFLLNRDRKFPGGWALLPAMGACLVILGGPQAWFNRKVLSNRAMVGLGLVSFPLYLWHWPVLTLLGGAGPAAHPDVWRVGLLLVSVGLAWLTYEFVEKPFRLGEHARRKALVLASAMAAVACVSAVVMKDAGVPSRYPEIIQKATQYDLEGYRAALRDRKCFMEMDQGASSFAPECIDAGDGPLWFLWGDSEAGVLYPGLRAVAAKVNGMRLAQFTSSACPPLLKFAGSENKQCLSNNEHSFEMMKAAHPAVVVLAASWGYYDITDLVDTIASIRRAGVAKLVLIGPPLTWTEPPSRIVFDLWKADPLHRLPPARLDYKKFGRFEGTVPSTGPDYRGTVAEPKVKAIAAAAGVPYASVFDALCNEDGCLMRESDESPDPFFFDIAHLNKTGSEFVAERLLTQLGMLQGAGEAQR